MAQQRGGGGGQDSNMEMWIFLIVVMFVIAFWGLSQIFWVYATGWKWLRISEIYIVNAMTPISFQKWIGWDFKGGLEFLLEANPRDLTSEMIAIFDNIYVRFFNWLPSIFLALVGAKLFLNADNVSSRYDMETLLLKMSNAFPHNKAFMNIHPEETPLDFYPDDPNSFEYSMAMTERQFAQVVPPLGLLEAAKKNKKLRKPIWDGEKGFDDELCRLSFESQIGPLYMGYNRLGESEKKLFDIFRANILIKRKEALPLVTDYMEQIVKSRVDMKVFQKDPAKNKKSSTSKAGKPVVTMRKDFPSHKALVEKLTPIIDALMMKNGSSYQVKEIDVRSAISVKSMKPVLKAVMADTIMSKHAYVYTGLMSLLESAREGSTLPPSSLRWLKIKNRTLWYALNCVGKKVSFTESGGTFAQWILEKTIKIPVPHPEVTEAIEALRIALELKPMYPANDEKDVWG